jgi:hypothetical protein
MSLPTPNLTVMLFDTRITPPRSDQTKSFRRNSPAQIGGTGERTGQRNAHYL